MWSYLFIQNGIGVFILLKQLFFCEKQDRGLVKKQLFVNLLQDYVIHLVKSIYIQKIIKISIVV